MSTKGMVSTEVVFFMFYRNLVTSCVYTHAKEIVLLCTILFSLSAFKGSSGVGKKTFIVNFNKLSK
jgi:hypothetical protein